MTRCVTSVSGDHTLLRVLTGTTKTIRGIEMFLHIYAQQYEHDTAWLVGDEQSLIALRNTIDRAISNHHSSMSSFTSDGEGFITTVILTKDDCEKNEMTLPYAIVLDTKSNVLPSDLIQSKDCKKLHKEPDFK
jgi:hypothetical protein